MTFVPVSEYEPAAQVRVRFWEDEAAVTVGAGGYMLDHTDDCIDSRGADYLRNTLSDISEMFSLDSLSS